MVLRRGRQGPAGQLSEGDGRYYLRARQYDPVVGRFLQRDPAPSQTGVPVSSTYAYVDHRPTIHVDPSGRMFESADAGQRALAGAADSSLCPSYAAYGQRRLFRFGVATVAQGENNRGGALVFKSIWITAGFYGSAEYRGGHECKMLLQYGASYDTRQMAQIEGPRASRAGLRVLLLQFADSTDARGPFRAIRRRPS